MRILLLHSHYVHRGGEDAVFEAERDLLRAHGHEVRTHEVRNELMSGLNPLQAASRAIWSGASYTAVRELVRAWRPDVVHAHNTFQALSPSVLSAAAREGLPVVQTLHNFRLMCPQAMLLRHEQVCEDCVGKVPWRGVVRACYRDSHLQSAALATMLMAHRALGTYERHVTRFIALSEFSRRKLMEGGLDGERISVKPNFYETDRVPSFEARDGGLFVGRLSREKGVEVLLRAARDHGLEGVAVIGDGPEFGEVMRVQFGTAWLGFQPLEAVLSHMARAAFLVLPSICYENFPRTIVEAYASGTPVIASAMGAMAELVEDGVTGLLFTPGDAAALARKVAWAQAHPDAMRRMGEAAFARYQARYRAEVNHGQLMAIYQQAIEARRAQTGGSRG